MVSIALTSLGVILSDVDTREAPTDSLLLVDWHGGEYSLFCLSKSSMLLSLVSESDGWRSSKVDLSFFGFNLYYLTGL